MSNVAPIMSPHLMFLASQVTQKIAFGMYIFVCYSYNIVFLRVILPAAGKEASVNSFTVMFNLFWCLAFWSYMQACLGNPGHIPARWQDFVAATGHALPLAPTRFEWQPGKATRCKKCDIIRPERAHHCAICDICVLRMDHHCPWINNCVGFANHKFFILLAIYTCIASVVVLATCIPELLYCMQELAGVQEGFAVQVSFSQHAGFISSGDTIFVGTLTIDEAKSKCTEMSNCLGFCFEGEPSSLPTKIYFKDKWDLWSTGWTSYRLEKVNRVQQTQLYLFLALGAVVGLAVMMLVPLLFTHVPNVAHNLTMIEENYDNMPNPFDQGSAAANVAQVFGAFGPDWFLPIHPRRPLSDGVSFARTDERLGKDGLPDPLLERESGQDDLYVEKLWKYRYHVRSMAGEMSESGPLSSVARWFIP